MDYPIPPWLSRTPDPASHLLAGFQAGAQVAHAQASLQAEAQRQAIALTEAQKRLQAEDAYRQQQLEVAKAYHDQMTSLQGQRLAAAQQRIQVQTQQAAQRYAAQRAYQQRFAQLGGTPDAARQAMLEQGPGLGITGQGMAALTRPAQQRPVWVPEDVKSGAPGHFETPQGAVHIPPQLRQDQLSSRDILQALRQQAKDLEADPDVKYPVPKTATPDEVANATQKKNQLNQIQARIKTMIAPRGKRVRVSKDGKTGTIPEEQLQDALDQGYTLVK